MMLSGAVLAVAAVFAAVFHAVTVLTSENDGGGRASSSDDRATGGRVGSDGYGTEASGADSGSELDCQWSEDEATAALLGAPASMKWEDKRVSCFIHKTWPYLLLLNHSLKA